MSNSNSTGTVNRLVRSNIFMSVAEKAEFARRAKKQGVSAATLIRQAMANFLGSDAEQFAFKTAAKK